MFFNDVWPKNRQCEKKYIYNHENAFHFGLRPASSANLIRSISHLHCISVDIVELVDMFCITAQNFTEKLSAIHLERIEHSPRYQPTQHKNFIHGDTYLLRLLIKQRSAYLLPSRYNLCGYGESNNTIAGPPILETRKYPKATKCLLKNIFHTTGTFV